MKSRQPSQKKFRNNITIGLLINDFSLAYQAAIAAGVFDAAAVAGANVISFTGGPDAIHFSAVYDLVGPQNVDGLIILAPILGSFIGPERLEAFCQRYQPLPMISIGGMIPGIPGVLTDEALALRDLITHLIIGHDRRRLVFLQGIVGNVEAEQRYKIYEQTLAEHEIPFDPELVVPGEFRFEIARDTINQMLDQRGLCFDAIVASNDYMALGALDALQMHNISVPDQVAVTGVDNIDESRFAWSPLTTIRQPVYEQGRRAVEILMDMLHGKEIQEITRLRTKMVIRQSCGCFSKEIQQASVESAPAIEGGLDAARQHLLNTLDFVRLEWLQELVDSFFTEMKGEKDFLAALRRIINEVISKKGVISQWQDVVSGFRKVLLPYLNHDEQLLAENLWHQARILIAEAMQREQAYRQLWLQEQATVWRGFSLQVATSSNLELLAGSAQDMFPRVGVKRCYLAFYDFRHGETAPAERARLVLTYDDKHLDHGLTRQQLFFTQHLLPSDIIPKDIRCNLVVEPVYREESTEIGFIVVELTNSYDWSAYANLRTHFTNALKTTVLIEQLVEKSHEREEFIKRLAHRTEQINTIMRVGQVAITFLDTDALLERVVKEVQTALNYDVVAIYLLDTEKNLLVRRAAIGIAPQGASESGEAQKIELDAPALVSAVAGSRRLMNNEDIGETSHQLDTPAFVGFVTQSGKLIFREKIAGNPDDPASPMPQSEVAIPLLIDGGNRLIGVLDIRSNYLNAFSADDLEILEILANQIAIAIHNAELFKASEKALQNANEANKAKTVFLANMSHELRTPLNAILGFAQLLGRERSLNAEQHENVRVILRSGEHLLGLINDVLEMSKIEAGQLQLIEVDFDFYQMLHELEEVFSVRAEQKNLSLAFNRAPNVPQFMRGDVGKIRQVLINLLSNSIKYTDRGGVVLRTYCEENFSNTVRKQRLVCEVEDTGRGIAAEEISRIFEPFVQSVNAQKMQEGTGLGLSISRRFVQLMGGEISVESVVSEKTIFRFYIEVTLTTPSTVEPYRNAGNVLGLERGQEAFHILVVEDRWENRQWLVRLLTAVGFDVREAIHGEEAVRLWKEWKPNLIFMDMQMPIMDGYTATKLIKAEPDGAKSIIIAVTASAFDHERDRIIAAGCDDFLAKPFGEASMFEKLEQHLHVRFMREAADPEPGSGNLRAVAAHISSASLAAFPLEWIVDVDKASLAADHKRLKELIERIRPQDQTLANSLYDLVKNYRFDTIHDLMQTAKSGQSTKSVN